MSRPPSGHRFSPQRVALMGIAALLLSGGVGGCRGKARDDLYRQKMAREIRVLEDQLYAADYENRVLHDKLERLREREANGDRTPSERSRDSRDARDSRSDGPRGSGSPRRGSTPDEQDTTLPSIDLDPPDPIDPQDFRDPSDSGDPIDFGDPMDDPILELPDVSPGTPVDDLGDPGGTEIDAPPSFDLPMVDPPDRGAAPMILPAPGGPEPPGKDDTDPSGVIPGEILPPPNNPEQAKPPGQIPIPDAAKNTLGIPAGLRIHRSLSGGHQFDDASTGILVVVNVVDATGQLVDVSKFDVDGELSIVVLDPEREPDQARLGRWDFKGQQIESLVRSQPTSGLHVRLKWNDEEPRGDDVIVHVRLRGEEDEMRCEQEISLDSKSIADWTPRASQLRRE